MPDRPVSLPPRLGDTTTGPEAVTIHWPVGSKAAERIQLRCPWKVRRERPDSMSHTMAVLSTEEERMAEPSGLQIAWLTSPVCPRRTLTSSPAPDGPRVKSLPGPLGWRVSATRATAAELNRPAAVAPGAARK